MAGKVATQLNEEKADRPSGVVRWRRGHERVQSGGVQVEQCSVHGAPGPVDFSEDLVLGEGVSRELLFPLPHIPVVAEVVSDEVAEVAAQVDGEGADLIGDAGCAFPQQIIRCLPHFRCQGGKVAREDVAEVIEFGRGPVGHAAKIVRPGQDFGHRPTTRGADRAPHCWRVFRSMAATCLWVSWSFQSSVRPERKKCSALK